MFKDCGAVVAGGTITSLFTNAEINDIDVYFPSKEAMVYCIGYAYGMGDICRYSTSYELILTNTTDKSMMFVDRQTKSEVQFIHFKYFDSVQDIFDTFDYTVCMGAYSFKHEGFILHPDFMKHNAQRYLSFNKGTAFPLLSVLRVDKYQKRGYTISKSEMLRVVMQCMNLGLSSWEDVKEHIGGMYGYDMTDVFDEDKEFNLDEVIDQLGSLDEKDIKKYIPRDDFDFDTLIRELHVKELEELAGKEPESPFKEGYYYKHVTEDLKSPYRSGSRQIDYSVGSVVNGGDNGVYVHTDPKDPHGYGDTWVELEPLEGARVIGDGGWQCPTETRIGGDLLVVRSFKHQTIDPHHCWPVISKLYDFSKFVTKENKVNEEASENIPY